MGSRRFITFEQLVERGIFNNRVTLDRAIKRYGFPPPYKLGGRRVCWNEAEVEAWTDSRRVHVAA